MVCRNNAWCVSPNLTYVAHLIKLAASSSFPSISGKSLLLLPGGVLRWCCAPPLILLGISCCDDMLLMMMIDLSSESRVEYIWMKVAAAVVVATIVATGSTASICAAPRFRVVCFHLHYSLRQSCPEVGTSIYRYIYIYTYGKFES